MELLMELFMEIVVEGYIELMLLVVPDKGRSQKMIWISRIMALLVLLGVVALVIWGIVLMEHNNRWGIAPIIVAAAISLIQMVAGVVLYVRNH